MIDELHDDTLDWPTNPEDRIDPEIDMPMLMTLALANGFHVECYGEGCEKCDHGWVW